MDEECFLFYDVYDLSKYTVTTEGTLTPQIPD